MSYNHFDIDDDLQFDSDGCFQCSESPRVKGRFGLAWVSESPECPFPEPIGWQVEFHDTPSKVEQKCKEMVRWINCPPLPRCDPCPPDELCSPNNPPRCNPCAPMTNPCHPSCQKRPGRQTSTTKRCCCCGKSKRCFPPPGTPYCRKRSPRRRGGDQPKCTCDDVPVKDTGMSSSGDYMHDTRNNKYYNSTSPQQVNSTDAGACLCAKETVMLYRNDKSPYNTDTENMRIGNETDDDFNAKAAGDKHTKTGEKGAEAKHDHGRSHDANKEQNHKTVTHDKHHHKDNKDHKDQKNHKRAEITVAQVQMQDDGFPQGCRECCEKLYNAENDCSCADDEVDHSKHKPPVKHEEPSSGGAEKQKNTDTEPKNITNYHKGDEKYKPSADSLDEALLTMTGAQDMLTEAHPDGKMSPHHGEGLAHLHKHDFDVELDDKASRAAMAKRRVEQVAASGKTAKHSRRPCWLSPCWFNLCSRFRDYKSEHEHKRHKSKSPVRKPASKKSSHKTLE